jgi:hypothetical protein
MAYRKQRRRLQRRKRRRKGEAFAPLPTILSV